MNRTSRRDFLKTVSMGAAVLAAGHTAAAAPKIKRPPNVILIMVDDMGFSDLGCYGSAIQTPNIDKLASDGLKFTQFYNTAKCEPTRASLLTGCYHREVGGGRLRNAMTIGQAMQQAGYRTLMTGKWHMSSTPVEKGFDRYFGHLSGATNFFIGDDTFRLDNEKFTVPKTGFYTTDANTDYAIQFLDQAAKKHADKPFFLYIAHNAPHYPLQAWPKDIAKYKGKFMKGWDALRLERHKRQLKMGLLDPKWKLAPRDKKVKAWDTLSDEQKKTEDLTMAVFAAMIDRVDQNVGKLMGKLKALNMDDNTLLLFLSDNGGCPFQRTRTPDIPPGPANSYWTYHEGWAQVSNTPFRLYKQNQHEGGVSTPLIAHWPGVVKHGTQTDQPGHIIDIMATLLDITATKYPETLDGTKLRPLRGKSLLPILKGGKRKPHDELFFEFAKYKALRAGKWKISWRYGPWELYDIEADRTELNDLADKMPKKVKELAARYEALSAQLGARRKKKRNRNNKKK